MNKKAKRHKHLLVIVLVFFLVFSTHLVKRNYQYGDSLWSTYTALSIVREGNTDLDEYRDIVLISDNFGIYESNGHVYSFFPIGTSVIALPFIYPANAFYSNFHTSYESSFVMAGRVEAFIASLIVALTAVFIYLIGALFLNRRYALVLVFIFAFCTSAWSTASRSLWQHGPTMLFLAIALYLILLARNKPRLIQYVALPLSFSFVIRPTNSISILFLTIYVLIQHRKYFLKYVLWSLPVVLPFVAFNLLVYGTFISTYYLPARLITNNTNHDIFEALAGNLISPARGIIIFSPVILVSIAGLIIKMKDRKMLNLDYFLLGIILMHYIVVSSNADWWGGWAFGPRFFTDMIPYFIYFMIPFLLKLPDLSKKFQTVAVCIFVCLVMFSFFVHFRGATASETWIWNDRMHTNNWRNVRLWDWGDIQFLAGIT